MEECTFKHTEQFHIATKTINNIIMLSKFHNIFQEKTNLELVLRNFGERLSLPLSATLSESDSTTAVLFVLICLISLSSSSSCEFLSCLTGVCEITVVCDVTFSANCGSSSNSVGLTMGPVDLRGREKPPDPGEHTAVFLNFVLSEMIRGIEICDMVYAWFILVKWVTRLNS